MGKFTKGQPKIAGRKKGTKNLATVVFEDLLLNKRAELLDKAIELAMDGNERILIKLLDKIVPTLTAMDLKTEIPEEAPEFENMSDEDLTKYIETH